MADQIVAAISIKMDMFAEVMVYPKKKKNEITP